MHGVSKFSLRRTYVLVKLLLKEVSLRFPANNNNNNNNNDDDDGLLAVSTGIHSRVMTFRFDGNGKCFCYFTASVLAHQHGVFIQSNLGETLFPITRE